MKVAVLGVGEMGRTVIEHLKECELVTSILAYDINSKNLQIAKQKYGVKITEELNEVLNDASISLVFITSPNDSHKDLALKAMASNKAVLCEKPMALTLEDAEKMVQYAEDKNIFFQIGFELRYSKLYTKVKEWIDRGLLGDIINTQCTYISSQYPECEEWVWRCKSESCGSTFGERLSHYVDLPRWWIGSQVKDIYAVCAPNVIPYYEVHDNYHANYHFDNGAVSQITFMSIAAFFEGDALKNVIDQQVGDGHALRYRIIGTRGMAETSVFDRYIRRWEFYPSGDKFKSQWIENLTWPSHEDHFYFHNTTDQTKDVVKRVAQGQKPMTPARNALQTMKVCFAAELSADEKRIVSLEELNH